ncbi:MAG: hypothetical protein ACOVQ2_03235, partial [Flavobacterium sp.]
MKKINFKKNTIMKKSSNNHSSVPPSGVRGLFPPLEGLGEVKPTIMKNILLLATTLFSIFTFANVNDAIINIPDANFKARLLAANPSNQIASTQTPDQTGYVNAFHKIDVNNDGEIQVSEALVIKYLNVSFSYASISSLSGIENFLNLILLYCHVNQLTSLNVSGLTNLQTLTCDGNQLLTLNVSGLTNLRTLYCNNNQLS